MFTLLILGIIAGAGLATVRMINIRGFVIGKYIYSAVIIVMLVMVIPARLSIPYFISLTTPVQMILPTRPHLKLIFRNCR